MLTKEQIEFTKGCLQMAVLAKQLPQDAWEAIEPIFTHEIAQRDEIDRLEKILTGEPLLKQLEFSPEAGLNLAMSHPIVAALMIQLVSFFELAGGKNYVEMQVKHPEKGIFLMTVQRVEGKTPHQLRVEAEFRVSELEKELAAKQ